MERFGDDTENFFGINVHAPTFDEADYLIGFRNVDELQGKAASTRQERIVRLRSREFGLMKDLQNAGPSGFRHG